MRRPLVVGALVAAVTALVASAALAVAVGTPAGTSARSSMMGSSGESMMGSSGGSMMGSSGDSMMGSLGGSMMGSSGGSMMGLVWLPGDGVAVSGIPAARARAATAADPAGLHPGEVIRFDNGFYVELKDTAGKPATEVIVNPDSGAVNTEPGPAMMWNTRFGMMGTTGGRAGSVDATKARTIAASWLTANRAGTTVGSIDAYPGYFTIDVRRNGAVSAMMSISSVTGAVWFHTWHGAFIAMQDS